MSRHRPEMPLTEYNEIIVTRAGATVAAVLNRPAALNALSLEMIRILSARLTSWDEDDGVKAVFLSGAGERAFCAGGDVKTTYKTGMAYRRGEIDERVLTLFYGEEYCLNRRLYHFRKPIVAFMNGITMGGGFGVAGPCRFRIVSESTVFAMPEVAIGFFPDVGSMYYLSRAPGEAGAWLALTGDSVGAADMLYGGLATHYVPLSRQPALREALARAIEGAGNDAVEGNIAGVLEEFSEVPAKPSVLQEKEAVIKECFSGGDVEAVLDRLRGSPDLWARGQADVIKSRSPVSLKVSLAHLRMSAGRSFDDVTAQDFLLAQHFMKGHDFYEGVRAQLVDKDKQPLWEPASLPAVTRTMVQDYFRPAGIDLEEIAA